MPLLPVDFAVEIYDADLVSFARLGSTKFPTKFPTKFRKGTGSKTSVHRKHCSHKLFLHDEASVSPIREIFPRPIAGIGGD